MFDIQGPAGEALSIPTDRAEDQPYFSPDELHEARDYLDEYGYTVIRGLIPKAMCQAVSVTVRDELAAYRGYLYRQTTANPELHVFNDRGFLMNPILNVQDVPSVQLGRFRSKTLDILTHTNVKRLLETLFDEPGKLVQSMYFQGNTATWAHQDTYYLDAEEIGTMVAGWFALEDIKPGAGRFFIYPRSHRIDMEKNGGDFDYAFNHERYKKLVIDLIHKLDLKCAAPALEQGDALFWNSKTIHGSLETRQREYSRASLTAHYIPESSRFLQFQSRIKPLQLREYNGMQVNHPKSLDNLTKRMILNIETSFPRSFRFAKKVAVKFVTSA
ncbi:MAG: phytanoyl-CoA dioxygenase family protein [Rhodospirillaceae bacterium]